jgi:hypothetical protein
LVTLVIERVRALCFRGPIDPEPVIGILSRTSGREERRTILEAIQETFVGKVLSPFGSPAISVDVDLEESLIEARQAIERGLGALRIGANMSTFFGFVGVAIELSWIYAGDHGLLALDPRRVAAIGMNGAALSIAIGVGGSSFALGSWMALRAQATRLVHECERVVDRARGQLRGE